MTNCHLVKSMLAHKLHGGNRRDYEIGFGEMVTVVVIGDFLLNKNTTV